MAFFAKILSYCYYFGLSVGCLNYPEQVDYIEVNGQRLMYVTRGPENGKPVVLVHGNGGSHKSLRTQAKQLARAGYRVYSPDSRGQGANAPLTEYHYADMAEDTYQFIVKLGLDHPAFFGWSDGGIIGLMLEMAHPGTLGPAVVSGANLYPDCGDNFEEFKAWILSEGTPLALMMLSEPDIRPEDLKVVDCPMLVTVGSGDLISVEHTKLISDNVPGARLMVFEGEDHGSYIKRSPKLWKAMSAFFKEKGY